MSPIKGKLLGVREREIKKFSNSFGFFFIYIKQDMCLRTLGDIASGLDDLLILRIWADLPPLAL